MIRVLIVDDSPLMRRVLRELLTTDPSLTVIGEAADGQEAIAKTRELRPDVVTMDVDMPVLDGLAATEHIMAYHPTPILAISALVSDRAVGFGFRMLGAGALDVMDKPTSLRGPELTKLRNDLIQKVKLLARVRVVTHLRGRRMRNPPPLPPLSTTQAPEQQKAPASNSNHTPVVAIGASTGGPKALQMLLTALPRTFRAPILVVQHIADGFVLGMAEWLAQSCVLPISLAQHGTILAPGEVYIAPSGLQMLIDSERRIILSEQPQTSQRPSVDVTMQSVAESLGAATIGVLLTGMGRDGAAGLGAIKAAGGYTIAQDESTSAIFGMPKAAIEMGAAQAILPLDQIAPTLIKRLSASLYQTQDMA